MLCKPEMWAREKKGYRQTTRDKIDMNIFNTMGKKNGCIREDCIR